MHLVYLLISLFVISVYSILIHSGVSPNKLWCVDGVKHDIIGQHVSAMSIQPMKTQEQNGHTCESFDPAHHSDQAGYKEDEMLQERIKNPTAPRKELGEGDTYLT